jgi:hypothetical protein
MNELWNGWAEDGFAAADVERLAADGAEGCPTAAQSTILQCKTFLSATAFKYAYFFPLQAKPHNILFPKVKPTTR